MGSEPSLDLYGYLQRQCSADSLYEATKVLDGFRRVVNAGRWLHPRPRPLTPTIVSLKVFESCTGRSFDTLHSISATAAKVAYSFLTDAVALDVACGMVRATCLRGANPEHLVQVVPAAYLRDDLRTGLKAACYREAKRAASCVAPQDYNQDVRSLLTFNTQCLLFNYLAPHLDVRRKQEAERCRPAVAALDTAVVLTASPDNPKVLLYWEA